MNRILNFFGVLVLSASILASCGGSQESTNNSSSEGEDSVAVAGEEGMNNDLSDDTSTPADRILYAVMSTRLQSELSRIAEQKSSNQTLMELSQSVIDTNDMIISKIRDLAEATETQIPEALNTDQQQVVDSLQKLPNEEFDQAYIQVMVKDQKQLMDNLQALLGDESEPITRGLVEDIIDMQQPQLERVQAMQEEMM